MLTQAGNQDVFHVRRSGFQGPLKKLKAGIGFTPVVGQLLDYLKETQLGDDGPGADEVANRMQEARSAPCLRCASDTVDLADALARRVWSVRPTDGRDDRRAEHREMWDLLRRFTLRGRVMSRPRRRRAASQTP
ncbi:hypothetical protein BKA18_007328 [Streptomyces auratus]